MAATKFRERANGLIASGDTGTQLLISNHHGNHEEDCDALKLEYRAELFRWAIRQIRPAVTEPTWQAFWRTAVDGADAKQIADELKTTIGSVYTAKCRVISRIQKLISELDEDAESDIVEANK